MENTLSSMNTITQPTPAASVLLQKRHHWIDIAKGLCIIAVILGHLKVPELGFVYSFHLTTFFVLSGYTLKQEPINAKFLRKKFNRLMAPYFITCAMITVMRTVNLFVLNNDPTVKTFTSIVYQYIAKMFFASGGRTDLLGIDMGTYSAIGAIWFLPAMFFALVITQFILNTFQDKKQQMFIGIIISVIAAISNLVWTPFSIQAGFFAVPFVLLGKYIRENSVIEKMKWWHLLMLAAVFALGCHTEYAQAFYAVDNTVKDWLFTPACAIASSLLVLGLAYRIKRLTPIEFLGRNSMLVLCVHIFEMTVVSQHLINLRAYLGIPETKFFLGLMRLLFAVIGTSLIVLFSKRKKGTAALKEGTRNVSIDVMRAILIVLMIIGHSRHKAGNMSIFIYSFHMMSFVMISGYFFRSEKLTTAIIRTLKTLIPYGVAGAIYICVNHLGWPQEIKNVIAGVSFTRNYLTDVNTLGPVYFIPLLCVIRLIYIFVDRCKNETAKHCIVIALVALGVHLGTVGAWLPWSVDCALFSVIFYHIAHYMRKHDFLNKCKENPSIYFPAAAIWAFFIYKGGMELAARNYGSNIGLTIIGCVSAFIIVWMFSDDMVSRFPSFVTSALSSIGQSTLYILIIHALFDGRIAQFVANITALPSSHIGHLVIALLIQLIAGVFVLYAVKHLKKLFGLRTKNTSSRAGVPQ